MPADIPPPSAKILIEARIGSQNHRGESIRCLWNANSRNECAQEVMEELHRRCHAAEDECERLRWLRDRAEVAFKELEAAERRLDRLAEDVRENDRLRAELKVAKAAYETEKKCAASLAADLAEAVNLLEPFADIGIPDNWPSDCVLTWNENCRAGVFVGRYASISYLSSNVDPVTAPKIVDYRSAAAFVANHKGNAEQLADPVAEMRERAAAKIEQQSALLSSMFDGRHEPLCRDLAAAIRALPLSWCRNNQPTHWMPLPSPPSNEEPKR